MDPSSRPPEKREKREDLERVFDQLAEEMILSAKHVNEGNNGIILRFDVTVLNPDLRQLCRDSGIRLDEDPAVKVIKLYQPGTGREEFELHKRAYAAVLQTTEPVAFVPKPLFYRDIQLSTSARERMASWLQKKEPPERAELIVMDFIEGEDLATVLLKKALLFQRPDIQPEEIQNAKVEWLQQEVGPKLFHKAGGKGATQEERQMEQEKVETENAQRLYRFLANKQFRLDPSILERIGRTLRLIHGAGIVHRDLHERNIMVTGDPTPSGMNQVYVIDFGGASTFEGGYVGRQADLYQDGERRYYQDEVVVSRLEELVGPIETPQDRLMREDGERLADLLARLRKQKGFAQGREKWIALHEERFGKGAPVKASTEVSKFFQHFFRLPDHIMKDEKYEKFVDYLATFVEEGRTSAEEVTQALGSISETMTTRPGKNRLLELGRALKYLETKKRQTKDG